MIRIAVAALAFVAALLASASASGTPGQDIAVGTIKRLTLAGFPITVHVHATSGPEGEDARGKYWSEVQHPDLGTLEIRGDVTCLATKGNKAAVLATIDKSTDPQVPVGSEVQAQITDNGSPGAGADSQVTIFGFQPHEGCPHFFELAPEVTILHGDFTVKDR